MMAVSVEDRSLVSESDIMVGSAVIMEGELDKCSDFWHVWRSRYFQLRLCHEEEEAEAKPSLYLYYWSSRVACEESPNLPRGVFHMNKMQIRLGNEREIVCFDHLVQKGKQYVESERILLIRAVDRIYAMKWLRKLAYAHVLRNYPERNHRSLFVGLCRLEKTRRLFRFELKSVGRKALLSLWKYSDGTPVHSDLPEYICDLNRCEKVFSPDENTVVVEQTRDLMTRFQAQVPKCFVYTTIRLCFEDKTVAQRVLALAKLKPSHALIQATQIIQCCFIRCRYNRKRASAVRIQRWYRNQAELKELRALVAAELEVNENLVDHLVLQDMRDQCQVFYQSTDNSFEEMVDELDLSELSESLEYSSGSPSPDSTECLSSFPVPLTPSQSILLEREEWQSPRPTKLSPVDELKEREVESPQLEPIPHV